MSFVLTCQKLARSFHRAKDGQGRLRSRVALNGRHRSRPRNPRNSHPLLENFQSRGRLDFLPEQISRLIGYEGSERVELLTVG